MRSVASPALVDQSLSRKLSRYLPLVLWIAFIFLASTSGFSSENTSGITLQLLVWLFPDISAERLVVLHGIIRKAAHFVEYFVLGVLAARAFSTSFQNLIQRHWIGWSILLVVSCALLDEYHQSFVPSRTGTIYDSFIDIVGGLTAVAVYKGWTMQASRRVPG